MSQGSHNDEPHIQQLHINEDIAENQPSEKKRRLKKIRSVAETNPTIEENENAHQNSTKNYMNHFDGTANSGNNHNVQDIQDIKEKDEDFDSTKNKIQIRLTAKQKRKELEMMAQQAKINLEDNEEKEKENIDDSIKDSNPIKNKKIKKDKKEKSKIPKKTNEEIMERLKNDPTFTQEEPEEFNDKSYDLNLKKLEQLSRERQSKPVKSRVSTYKSRNKLFGEFTDLELLHQTDETQEVLETECLSSEKLTIQTKEKVKKDISGLLCSLEKYKIDKIGLSNETETSQNVQVGKQGIGIDQESANIINTQPIIQENLNKSQLSSQNRQGSLTISNVLNNTSSSVLLDDSIYEIELTVPQLNKNNSSQTIMDTTLFLTSLTRKPSFIKTSSIGRSNESNVQAKTKTLKDLGKELTQQLRRKKSQNLSIDLLQERFQTRDLDSLAKKPKNSGENNQEDDDENDSDYCPENEKSKEVKEDAEIKDMKSTQSQEPGNLQEIQPINNQNPISADVINTPEAPKKKIDLKAIKELEHDDDDEEEKMEEEEENEEEEEEDDEEDVKDDISNSLVIENGNQDENDSINGKVNSKNADEFQDFEIQLDEVKPKNEDRISNKCENKDDNCDNKLKKLKRIKDLIMDSMQKEKERKKKQKKEERERMKLFKNQFVEMEAELGSDNDDDKIKQIDANDEEENEDGLDKNLDELIDDAMINLNEEDEQQVIDLFIKGDWKNDKEQIRKVIDRQYNNKKRKRDIFEEIQFENEDEQKKRLKRMEDVMKKIEEEENEHYKINVLEKNKANDEDDIFNNEDREMKKFDLLKAKLQIKKTMQNQVNKDEKICLLDDNEKFTFVSRKGQKTVENKTNILPKKPINNGVNQTANQPNKTTLAPTQTQTPTINTHNPIQSLIRGNKNSIMRVKTDKNNISILNNYYNQDIMNEYGKAGMFGNIIDNTGDQNNSNSLTEKPKSNKIKIQNKNENAITKIFNSGNDPKNPSPNKVFMFKFRKEK